MGRKSSPLTLHLTKKKKTIEKIIPISRGYSTEFLPLNSKFLKDLISSLENLWIDAQT